MKKIVTSFVLSVLLCMQVMAYSQVRLEISDGISNKYLKQQMEEAVSAVLTEVNRSQEENNVMLSFSFLHITDVAQMQLNKLWENEHFRCLEEEIVERVLTTRTGFQVRGIPLSVQSANGEGSLAYQEAVINFDTNGIITSFYYTLNPELYSKLWMSQMQSASNEVTDVKDRMMIIDYVEHFRTSYSQKDIDFLRQVFSDDALIITGVVIKSRPSEVVPSGKRIVYTTQTKQEYLAKLSKIFRMNSYVKVLFDNLLITKHPSIKDIYGVTVHQKWNTSRYSDEGYVFMLWDFREPDTPKIHVRTWQPDYIDREIGQKLSPSEVFTLGDFVLK